MELKLCAEREENEAIEIKNLEIKKDEIEAQIEAEKKKKYEELLPKIDSYKSVIADLKEEIQHQTALVQTQEKDAENLRTRMENMKNTITELDATLKKLKEENDQIKGEPERHKKQVEVAQIARRAYNSELEKNNGIFLNVSGIANVLQKKKQDIIETSNELAAQYERYRIAIDQKEKQCTQLLKDSEKVQNSIEQDKEKKAGNEGKLRNINLLLRKKAEDLMIKERDANEALKALRRAQYIFGTTKKSIPTLQLKIEDVKKDIIREREYGTSTKKNLEELKEETNGLITEYTKSEDVQRDVAEQLKLSMEEVKEYEKELDKWMKKEIELDKEISRLTVLRDGSNVELLRATKRNEKALEQVKMNHLMIFEMEKIQSDRAIELEKFEELYNTVKNERNKKANALQATQLLGTELNDKTKILKNEIDILSNESRIKDKALNEQKTRFLESCAERDIARGDINKALYTYQLKEEMVEQGMAEVKKFNMIIKHIENEMLLLREKYLISVDQRNDIGIQLVHRNQELCLLYEKSNALDSILRNGEIELKKREEEIRILDLHSAELLREVDVHRKHQLEIPKLDQERQQLFKLLTEKQLEAQLLIQQLETPENKNRWRALDGDIPTKEELEQQRDTLERKINAKEEQLLEKEYIFQQANQVVEKLKDQTENQKEGVSQLAIKLNDFKARIKAKNKQIQSTLAQIAVVRSTVKQLEREKMEKDSDFTLGAAKLEHGDAPSDFADKTWQRSLHDQQHKDFEKRAQAFAASNNNTLERPSLYIPDTGNEFELPRPYPNSDLAPLKPAEIGTHIRHFKNAAKPRTIVDSIA